jgi:hypothetical protein
MSLSLKDSSHSNKWCCDNTSACALTSTIMAVYSFYMSPHPPLPEPLSQHTVSRHMVVKVPHTMHHPVALLHVLTGPNASRVSRPGTATANTTNTSAIDALISPV